LCFGNPLHSSMHDPLSTVHRTHRKCPALLNADRLKSTKRFCDMRTRHLLFCIHSAVSKQVNGSSHHADCIQHMNFAQLFPRIVLRRVRPQKPQQNNKTKQKRERATRGSRQRAAETSEYALARGLLFVIEGQ
jgi:hypothetical protein